MKKFALLFLAIAAIGCGSDDGPTTPANPAIVGTWKPVSRIVDNHWDGVQNQLDACDALYTRYTFHPDGKLSGTESYGDNTSSCTTTTFNVQEGNTWSMSGNTLIMNNETGYPHQVTFTNNNNTMTTVADDGGLILTTVWSRIN